MSRQQEGPWRGIYPNLALLPGSLLERLGYLLRAIILRDLVRL